jgi:hypothetical protein
MHYQNSLIYPNSRKFKFTLAFLSSVFIYLFLMLFQPFGVNNYQAHESISWKLAVELMWIIPVLFFTIMINEFGLRPKLRLEEKNIFLVPWFAYFFISIGTSSFLLYNYLGDFHDFSFSSYVQHIFEIGIIFIFPFIGTVFFFNFNRITKDYAEALSLSSNLSELSEIILIKGDYKKDQITLRLNSIIHIEAMDNYLGITFLENDQVKKHLVRATLSKMDSLINNKLFIQCNRSVIINLFHFESIKKNGSGLILKLKSIENDVKVSKSKSQDVVDLIEKHLNSVSS